MISTLSPPGSQHQQAQCLFSLDRCHRDLENQMMAFVQEQTSLHEHLHKMVTHVIRQEIPPVEGWDLFMKSSTFETHFPLGPGILFSIVLRAPIASHQLLLVGEPSIIVLTFIPASFFPSPLNPLLPTPFSLKVMVMAVSMLSLLREFIGCWL